MFVSAKPVHATLIQSVPVVVVRVGYAAIVRSPMSWTVPPTRSVPWRDAVWFALVHPLTPRRVSATTMTVSPSFQFQLAPTSFPKNAGFVASAGVYESAGFRVGNAGWLVE